MVFLTYKISHQNISKGIKVIACTNFRLQLSSSTDFTHAGIQEFCQGPGLTARKQLEHCFFLVLNLFYSLQIEGSNGFITEKTILFQGSRVGLTFSKGGPTFSRGWGGGGGGPNANFYRNLYNL